MTSSTLTTGNPPPHPAPDPQAHTDPAPPRTSEVVYALSVLAAGVLLLATIF
jgi:hypothetical protein